MTTEKLVCERLCIDFCNKYEEQKSTIRAQEARIAELTTQEEIRKQLESETFEEYDWFYKLKFICRVLGNDGNAPKEDWRTAYGMARSLFDSAWLVQREKPELTKDAEPDRLKFFDQIWRWKALKDGEIIYQYGEHVPSLFQKTAELLPTHPPAPKAITADMVTDEMVEMFEGASPDELGWWGDSDRDDIIAAAVNAFNGVKP